MPTTDFSNTILDTLRQHLPPEAGWIPILIMAIVAAAGLVTMAVGARLAPLIGALAFALAGGYGGSHLASWVGTPLWPTVVATGVVGLGVGFALYRIWVALLVAVCVMSLALGVYGHQMLREPIQKYLAGGLDQAERLVTLKPASAPAASGPAARAELAGLWAHLSTNVPSFQASLFTIIVVTGVAGFIFGLLLPRAASALLAATLGGALVGTGGYGVVHLGLPAYREALNGWGPIALGALWGIAFIFNLADMYGLRRKKPLAAAPKPSA